MLAPAMPVTERRAASRRRLRLLVRAGAPPFPRWLHDVARQLRRRCELVLDPTPAAPAAAPLAWRAALELDRRVFAAASPALKPVLEPLASTGGAGAVDLVLDCVGGADRAGTPRLGLRIGGRRFPCDPIAGAAAGPGVTPVEAVLECPGRPPCLLAQRLPPTIAYSARRNLEHACARLPDVVEEAVEVFRRARAAPPATLGAADSPSPLRHGLRALRSSLVPRALRALRPEQWLLAWSTAPLGDDFRPRRLRALLPPHEAFWADPCVIAERGGHTIFFEDFRYELGRGRIARMRIVGARVVEGPQTVLETPQHLSYPHLFRWRGALFMLPENAAAGYPLAWRCTRFPDGWSQEAVLMDEPWHDASLVEVEGRWWLFACQAPRDALPYDELHLYHAPTPLGPWTPHRANPVKSDARSSRPAGAPFFRGGRLFRPAQDCTRYGSATRIMEVTALDPQRFAEREAGCLRPDWLRGGLGQHTLNADGGMVVVDALRRRPLA